MVNKVTVTWKDGMYFEGETPNFPGVIPLDSDESVGGQGLGHRPLKMLLVSLGGCMAMDVVSILRKKRQEFTHFQVTFETRQRDEHPKSYTEITMHFTAGGPNISEEALARALELSYTKYCPVNAMLQDAVDIRYTYEIIEAEMEEAVI
jgi:putative redox protein